MDKKIILKLYSFTTKHNLFCNGIKFIINLSAYIFFLFFCVTALILAFNYDERIFKFLFVVGTTIFFNMTIRKLIDRKRPFAILPITPIIEQKPRGSFPSNHSTSAMVIALSFLYLNFYFGIIFIAMAIITGISRVFAGIHYITDVIAGLSIGAILGYIGFFVF